MKAWRTSASYILVLLGLCNCARREAELGIDHGSNSDAGHQPITDAATQKHWDIPDVSFTYEGLTDDAAVTSDAACANSPVAAEPAALDLYLMLDRSASMAAPLQTVPNCKVGDTTRARWCYAINALAGFFRASTSNGMGVALQFFPNGSCGWVNATEQNCCAYGDCCSGATDAVPAVTLGQLPENLPKLITALNQQSPLGTTTPMEAALRGLISYTQQAKSPGRNMVAILATDGDPNGCDLSTKALAALISQHEQANGIKTFIIGTDGANFQTLEQLAIAGGAAAHSIYCAPGFSSCHFFNVGAGEPEAFIDALQQIQRSVVGCRFSLPQTDAGIVDPTTLVVQVVSAANADRQILPRRPTVSDCGRGGWYAEPDSSGEFALCPESCTSLQSQVGVSVQLLAGCLGS